MKTIETYLPYFNGFYNTIWEGLIESEENSFIEYYNDEHNTELTYDDFEWDYKEIRDDIVEQIGYNISNILKEIGVENTLEVQSIQSPREYNFSNDSANIEITFDEVAVRKILEDNMMDFEGYIEGRYTSYDGFTSSHSRKAQDWIDEIDSGEWGTHKTGSILEYILTTEFTEEQIYLHELHGNIQDLSLYPKPNYNSIGEKVAEEYINEVLEDYKTEDETIKSMVDALIFEKGQFENMDRVFLSYAQLNRSNLELQKLFNDYTDCLYKAGLTELADQTDKVRTHSLGA